MPKQLVAVKPRKAAILDYTERSVKANEVKIRLTNASPKHGSELAAFRGESPHQIDYYNEEWRLFLPREEGQDSEFGNWNLGNQWVGIIEETGSSVTDYAIGDRVCGYGGIRETHNIVAVDNFYLFPMPEDMSWKSAVCLDPAIFALGGIRDGHVRVGDRVAVFGLGAIGQIAVQMAKLAGASYVAAVDPIEHRREVALRNGACDIFNPLSQDVGYELKKATEKMGVDVVIETSANELAMNQVLRGLSYGGTVAYVGWARPFRGGMNWGNEAHFNNAHIVFSRSCSEPNPDHPRWSFRRIEETCWKLLSDGLINCEDVIYPVVHFNESATAYEKYVDRHPEKSIKLGIEF
ncbi:zinc-binding alcohol dehydrogenase [Lederbergia sp. NSJ-179]|uniref:zinc-dependent alcohol dehydrogenase n=1 Tax=Lederbergia sp. NSJ-179 TaxID=2931402 RepID=UPI001FD14518|nr:zinc-binding alcohol dehydrogenase [Lederbergia sp. NSJ-179]MCJ7842096.1 zinc-binding alcohol dehydrogenase [Lederbergia sp. NSJ-179]